MAAGVPEVGFQLFTETKVSLHGRAPHLPASAFSEQSNREGGQEATSSDTSPSRGRGIAVAFAAGL